MTRMMIVSGFLMAGLALVACGDDGNEPNGGETGGGELDGKQLQELTASEAQSVCADVDTTLALSDEDSCEVLAAGLAILGGDCEATKQMCLSGEGPTSSSECDTSKFAGCSVTVAELNRCTSASAAQLRSLTCASTLEDLAAEPEECQVVKDKCPELLEVDDETEGGGA
ncbi:hypothetical protein SOCE26_105240 [Sorangium cellulosum]|uniref:Secreted protein n=1 Tax=Sorangium cellulosum TaxID=56 RepID=A0A2L0FC41_SORCE|nr:hypothetical protein [Sorangium cellulosum]AUX48979.1 hypothetical protein SOCE26_105240 [Sorangium cellulosum]